MLQSKEKQLEGKAARRQIALARTLAPEDIRPGDYVAVLRETSEWPSFIWDHLMLAAEDIVRIATIPKASGTPFKVKSVCLPFVLVKTPTGDKKTLDIRRCELARLQPAFAKAAWKARKSGSTSHPECQ